MQSLCSRGNKLPNLMKFSLELLQKSIEFFIYLFNPLYKVYKLKKVNMKKVLETSFQKPILNVD